MVDLKFTALFRRVKGQSLLKFVYLFQVKFNFSIENIFYRAVSRHQKYIDLQSELCFILSNIIEKGMSQPLLIFALSTKKNNVQ